MCDTRQDLAQKLSTFGADIPTTSMHWKKQGNQLEWIVRHMSWAAPWTSTGKEKHKESMADKTRSQTRSRRLAEARATAEQAANDLNSTLPVTELKPETKHIPPEIVKKR